MIPYKLLRIKKKPSAQKNYFVAECFNHLNSREITFNNKLFHDIEDGTNFIFGDKSEVIKITEEEVPIYVAKYRQWEKELDDKQARIKAENIASGRFNYFYTDFREGKAENIHETLTDNYDELWQKILDRTINKYNKDYLTIEVLKKDERLVQFVEKYQQGDILKWYSWDGGFLAYSAGFLLIRGDEQIAHYTVIVS